VRKEAQGKHKRKKEERRKDTSAYIGEVPCDISMVIGVVTRASRAARRGDWQFYLLMARVLVSTCIRAYLCLPAFVHIAAFRFSLNDALCTSTCMHLCISWFSGFHLMIAFVQLFVGPQQQIIK